MNGYPESSAAALFSRCCALLKAGDPKARADLSRLEAHGTYSPGWCQLGETLLELGQTRAAQHAFERALAGGTANTRAAIGEAKSLLRLKDPTAAEAILAGVLPKTAGERAQVCRLRVRSLHAAGRTQDSLQEARAGLQSMPDDAELWFRFALAAQDLADLPTAIAGYRHALKSLPSLFEASLNLGTCLQETGNISAAMQAYARAVDLSPACFNRVAQALSAAPRGRLWLHANDLRAALARALADAG